MTRVDLADPVGKVGVPIPFLPPEASVKKEDLPHRRRPGFRQVYEYLSSQMEPCGHEQPQPLGISRYPDGSFCGMSHSCPWRASAMSFAPAQSCSLFLSVLLVSTPHSIHSATCGAGTDNTAGTRASTCHMQPRAGGQQTDNIGLQRKMSSVLGETAGLPEQPCPLALPPAAHGSHCSPVFAPTFVIVWSFEF